MIRKYFLLLVAFLLLNSIVFAISDIDCDTSDNRGNNLCRYTGIYKSDDKSFTQLRGDNNPNTQEEQDSFGTGGLRTKIDPSGIDVSFGGGAMDWYGYACDRYSAPGHCVGVDVKTASINCIKGDGNWESTPFYDDPCPDGMCAFLVNQQTSPRRITKVRCNFLPTTPVGKSYSVEYDVVMDYYDSHNNNLVINDWFRVTNEHSIGCTIYQGCESGQTCVAVSDTKTECQGPACECTSGACCDGCNYYPSGSQPSGKTDGYVGNKFCSGNDVYQAYRDWYCTGSSSTSTYTDTNKLVEDCPDGCLNGECQAACTDECDITGMYCDGNKLMECYVGTDGCNGKKEVKTCPEGCWDKACRPYKLKFLFVPLGNWEDLEEFNTLVDEQMDTFKKDIPINECYHELVKLTKFDTAYSDFSCDITKIKPFLRKKGVDYDPYDYIFGLGLRLSCKIQGERWRGVAWVDPIDSNNNLDNSAVAHEIGHFFGLEDEYCSNQAGSTDCRCNDGGIQFEDCAKDINYLDPDPPFYCNSSENGGCCEVAGLPECDPAWWNPWDTGYGPCCFGNRNSEEGIATMSYLGAQFDFFGGERGYDEHSLAHLKTKNELKCD